MARLRTGRNNVSLTTRGGRTAAAAFLGGAVVKKAKQKKRKEVHKEWHVAPCGFCKNDGCERPPCLAVRDKNGNKIPNDLEVLDAMAAVPALLSLCTLLDDLLQRDITLEKAKSEEAKEYVMLIHRQLDEVREIYNALVKRFRAK